MPDAALKRCTRCGSEKPGTTEFFGPHKTGAGGLDPNCRTCKSELAGEWRRNNRDKHRTYSRGYYDRNREAEMAKRRQRSQRKLRAEVLAAYGGPRPACACCGESEQQFLAVDHVNGGGAEHRRELKAKGVGFYRWLRKNGFPPGFRILCHNCNMARGFYGSCPHERNPVALHLVA